MQQQQQGRRPRRSHAKSRNGCANCKRRKVKCDEEHPVCWNCKRHEFACSFSQVEAHRTIRTETRYIARLLPDLNAPSNKPPEGHQQTSTTPESSHDPTPLTHLDPLPPVELTRRGLELMHHYCTVTANTLSLRRDMAYVWQVAVAREGYNHSFVSDGVLALAAAHKAYLVPGNCEVYLQLCDYHSIVGSEAFRHDLQNSTKQEWTAQFAFASVLVLYAFTLPARSIKQKLDDPIARLLELASLARGMRTSLSPLVARIFVSEFAPLAYGVWPAKIDGGLTGQPSLDGTFLPNDFWDATARLRAFQQIELPLHSRAHYQDAVDKLEHAARIISVAGAAPEIGAIVTWLQDVDDCIFVDIAAYKPPALVLLAYFCVFLAGMTKNFWYVRGWGEQLFGRVEVLLESRGRFIPLLEWPRKHLDYL